MKQSCAGSKLVAVIADLGRLRHPIRRLLARRGSSGRQSLQERVGGKRCRDSLPDGERCGLVLGVLIDGSTALDGEPSEVGTVGVHGAQCVPRGSSLREPGMPNSL